MKEINELVREYFPHGYHNLGKACIVDTKNKKVVVKKSNNDIYDYLNSRSFNYYPRIIKNNKIYQVSEYIDEIEQPDEQKIIDMVELVALLHYKTTYFKNIDEDDYKKIYEDISNNIEHLTGYYDDLMNIIESKEYYSPHELSLALNISLVFYSLSYARNKLNEWLKIMEKKEKQRFVVLHNDLKLDHFLKNDKSYLISWDKSKIDIPIFDLYKLFKRYSLSFNFETILKKYEKIYPLLKEEKMLFLILISLPDKVEIKENEYDNTRNINKMIDMLFKARELVKENSKSKKEHKEEEQVK